MHRVSYEASGSVLDSMIASGIMTGFGDEWIKLRRDLRAHGRRIVLRADDGAEQARTRESVRRTKATSPRRRTSSTRGSSACIAPAFR